MTEENSGSFPASPAAPAATPQGMLVLNTKTLVWIATLFLGGAAGGGGLTLASGGDVNKLDESISTLTKTVATMNLTLTEIKGSIKTSDTRLDDVVKRLDRHEERILELEKN